MARPGLDREDAARADKTIGDHAAAIRDVIADQGDQPAILVAHSGANATVSLVLDRYPELVARVIWVDSGPVANGPALDPHSRPAMKICPCRRSTTSKNRRALKGWAVKHSSVSG